MAACEGCWGGERTFPLSTSSRWCTSNRAYTQSLSNCMLFTPRAILKKPFSPQYLHHTPAEKG